MNGNVGRGPFTTEAHRYLSKGKISSSFTLHSPNADLAFSTLRYFDVASFSAVFKQTITFIVDMIQS